MKRSSLSQLLAAPAVAGLLLFSPMSISEVRSEMSTHIQKNSHEENNIVIQLLGENKDFIAILIGLSFLITSVKKMGGKIDIILSNIKNPIK